MSEITKKSAAFRLGYLTSTVRLALLDIAHGEDGVAEHRLKAALRDEDEESAREDREIKESLR